MPTPEIRVVASRADLEWGRPTSDFAYCAYASRMEAQGSRAARDLTVLVSAGYGAKVRGLDLSHASLLSVSWPRQLWLERCSFASADLRHATLDGWHFKLCDLTGANMRGASLRGTGFAGCDLTGADLRDTDLRYASFGPVGVGNGAIETCLDRVLHDPSVDLLRIESS
jgi:uncharacterized protein YjbI with pentapeptide repeats